MLLELDLNIKGGASNLQDKIKLYNGKSTKDKNSETQQTLQTEMAQARELISDAKRALRDIGTADFNDKRKKPYRDLHVAICDVREQRFKKFIVKQWSIKDYRGYKEAIKALRNTDND
jgi:hypothetical protein